MMTSISSLFFMLTPMGLFNSKLCIFFHYLRKSLFLSFFFIAINAHFLIGFENKVVDEIALKQTLYTLEEGTSFKEITSCILAQDNLPELVKHSFIQQGRRFFVFSYPSDGLKVKSMISFAEGNKNPPLICILRGASRMEGLPA